MRHTVVDRCEQHHHARLYPCNIYIKIIDKFSTGNVIRKICKNVITYIGVKRRLMSKIILDQTIMRAKKVTHRHSCPVQGNLMKHIVLPIITVVSSVQMPTNAFCLQSAAALLRLFASGWVTFRMFRKVFLSYLLLHIWIHILTTDGCLIFSISCICYKCNANHTSCACNIHDVVAVPLVS